MNGSDRTVAPPGRVREITSLANPVVKDIRALFRKKHRDRRNAFIAEGPKLVVDALDRGWRIRMLIHAKSARAVAGKIAARAISVGGDVVVAPEKVLAAVTRRDNPQTVVGVFERRFMSPRAINPGAGDVWIALDRVRDPGNLGAVVRTADAVGAKGIVLVGDCVDPFSPEAVRATMGSIFSIPIARCAEAGFAEWMGRFDGLTVGAHLEGSVDYRSVDYENRPIVLLMGNEQRGLSEELANRCDELVRIPQAGRADSLNLAVSTGVMLYEIRRGALRV